MADHTPPAEQIKLSEQIYIVKTMCSASHPRRSVRCILGAILCALALLAPLPLSAQEPGQPGGAGGAAQKLHLPVLRGGPRAGACAPVATAPYSARPANAPEPSRPAETHADKNLALRGYARTTNTLGLIDYGGDSDPGAPQLRYLFADQRTARFSAVYQVHQWDWTNNRRGPAITNPPVTLAGLVTYPGEPLYTPRAAYDIGAGFQALVLYASEERITIKYTSEDNVVQGYTIHLEGICVDPALLALYRRLNAEGRRSLPALHGSDPIGRARTAELGVAVRDNGSFMDPRSRKDWWQ